MSRLTTRRFAAVVLAGVLAVAACGSDDGESDTTPTSAPGDTSAAAPTTTAEPGVPPASGEPIKLGFQWSESGPAALPDMEIGADAAVEYVNNKLGGVNGRPIELVKCGTAGTPESSTICANNFKDSGVPLVLISADPNEAVYPPVLQNNGIPVQANSSTGLLLTVNNTFASGSGAVGTMLGYAEYGRMQGHKSLLLIHIDNAGAAGVIALSKPFFQAAGVEVRTLPVASGTADITPQLQVALIDKPDYVGIFTDAPLCIAALKAKEVIGLEQELLVVPTCTTPEAVAATGDAVVGAINFSNRVPASETDEEAIAYRKALADFSSKTSPLGVASLGFTSVVDAHDVLATLPTGSQYTPTEIIGAYQAVKDLPLFMSGGGTSTCDGKQMPGTPFIGVCSTFINAFRFDGKSQEFVSAVDPSGLFG
jgi:branched-chain amino acid transport system substrate-binding protein